MNYSQSTNTNLTLKEIIGDVKFEIKLVGKTIKDQWEHNKWFFSISKNGKVIIDGGYHTGLGIKETPSLSDVLYSLVMDASAINMSFSDWCADFGYDSDSIKALNTYRTCEDVGEKLRKHFSLQKLQDFFQDY